MSSGSIRCWRLMVWSAACLLVTTVLWSSTSRIWKHRTRSERQEGDFKGVSLLADGSLILGPALTPVADTAEPYIWSLARDSEGNIFVGTGDEGRVYRLDPDGRLDLIFDAEEIAVHALAVDDQDHLYIGTSPRGRIYRRIPGGPVSEFYSPGAQYIWALALAPDGTLYAATGTEGKIHRIEPSGEGAVWVDTDETHVRTLVFDAGGDLVAGTDGTGLVLRIGSDGQAKVIARSPFPEVTFLVTTPDGGIVFSAVGQMKRRRRGQPTPSSEPVPQVAPTPTTPDEERPPGAPPGQEASPTPRRPTPAPSPRPSGPLLESQVVHIAPDGYARSIWSGEGDLILSLALDEEGRIMAGSGLEGRIYRIEPERADVTLLNRADSDQVSVLLPGPEGTLFAAGSNLGTLYQLGGKSASEGTYESAPYDGGVTASWGVLTWRAYTPSGTSIRLRVRTGDTPEPDSTWSAWSRSYRNPGGSPVELPPGRYVQWEASFRSSGGEIPRLGEVNLSFRQRNFPPEVISIEVQEPGVVFQQPNRAKSSGTRSEAGSSPSASETAPGDRRSAAQPRPQKEPNGRSVRWEASDPNQDRLLYSVYYRGVGERQWKTMEENLTDPFFSWDSRLMADGTYLLKVVADDSGSNPETTALRAERVSDPFEIDNNPPRVGSIETSVAGSTVTVRFQVSDSSSPVVLLEYSINAEVWKVLLPQDGFGDSAAEEYFLELKNLPAGEYGVVLKATDAAGNFSTAKAAFSLTVTGAENAREPC